MIDHLKPVPVRRVIRGADIGDMVEGHLGRVMQVAGDREHVGGAHRRRQFAAVFVETDGEHGIRKLFHEPVGQRLQHYLTNTFSR